MGCPSTTREIARVRSVELSECAAWPLSIIAIAIGALFLAFGVGNGRPSARGCHRYRAHGKRASNAGYVPTDLHVEYYAQRASAGLIIGEGTEVSPDAYGWADSPGLWSTEQGLRGSYLINTGLEDLPANGLRTLSQ